MKTVKVVIGSSFGDEGKGLMTDYFSSKAELGIVVRFNGGAQAGHTVVTPEGKRHVFGHFGSGTLLGLPTYLSSFFIVNPLLFNKEYDELMSQCKIKPIVYIDRYCTITTPYDMLINQIAEMTRGDAKHGSCGVGINETVVRSQHSEFLLLASMLYSPNELADMLKKIRDEYVPARLKELGIENVPEDYQRHLQSDVIFYRYLYDVNKMLDHFILCDMRILGLYDSIIFEGAQGLLLDQNNEDFAPHVTSSNTGYKNVIDLIYQAALEDAEIEFCYVTRAYLTRHGAGPFPTETEGLPYEGVNDLTNVPNEFQGTLRYGYLNLTQLRGSLQKELAGISGLVDKFSLAVTCMDQVGPDIRFILGDKKYTVPIKDFSKFLLEKLEPGKMYLSYGPTRTDVRLSELTEEVIESC